VPSAPVPGSRAQARGLRVWACPSLIAVYLAILCATWGNFGDLFIDRGFEFYLPWRMLHGSQPIRDFYLLVPPASYQLNSLLMRIAGESMSPLVAVAAANGALFVILLYLSLSRVTFRMLAWLVALSAIPITIFPPSIFGFHLPYCFGMPYASSAFLASFLCAIWFWETGRPRHFLAASLLYGLSLAFKNEFVLFGIVLFASPLLKGRRLKLLGAGVAASLVAPAMSFWALAAAGVSRSDWGAFFAWLWRFVHAPSLAEFYAVLGVYSLRPLLYGYRWWLPHFATFVCILLAFYQLLRPQARWGLRFPLLWTVFCLSAVSAWGSAGSFVWLGVASVVSFVAALCASRLRERGAPSFVVLAGAALVLASLKTIGGSFLWGYGSFFIPFYLGILAVGARIVGSPAADSSAAAAQRATFLTVLSIVVSLLLVEVLGAVRQPADTLAAITAEASGEVAGQLGIAGSWSVPKETAQDLRKIVGHISRARTPSSRLWVLPEGTLLNFILKLPGQEGFHNVTPAFAMATTEPALVDSLRKSPPHFIILHNSLRGELAGFELFGRDYCRELLQEVLRTYCRVYPVGSDLRAPERPLIELLSNRAEDCNTPAKLVGG